MGGLRRPLFNYSVSVLALHALKHCNLLVVTISVDLATFDLTCHLNSASLRYAVERLACSFELYDVTGFGLDDVERAVTVESFTPLTASTIASRR